MCTEQHSEQQQTVSYTVWSKSVAKGQSMIWFIGP